MPDTEVKESQVLFVETTLEHYNHLVDTGKIKQDALYFVSVSTLTGSRLTTPYLLFKGSNLIGNSGTMIQHAINGIIQAVNPVTKKVEGYNIVEGGIPQQLVGYPGQVMYVADETSTSSGEKSYLTHLYLWDETASVEAETGWETTKDIRGNDIKYTSIRTTGKWVDANTILTSKIKLGDKIVDELDLGKLIGLLVTPADLLN